MASKFYSTSIVRFLAAIYSYDSYDYDITFLGSWIATLYRKYSMQWDREGYTQVIHNYPLRTLSIPACPPSLRLKPQIFKRRTCYWWKHSPIPSSELVTVSVENKTELYEEKKVPVFGHDVSMSAPYHPISSCEPDKASIFNMHPTTKIKSWIWRSRLQWAI